MCGCAVLVRRPTLAQTPEDMAALFAMVPVGTVVRFINVPVGL
jgi:hypothetical protein